MLQGTTGLRGFSCHLPEDEESCEQPLDTAVWSVHTQGLICIEATFFWKFLKALTCAAFKCSFACLCFVWELAVSCCNWSLFDYQAIALCFSLGQDKEKPGRENKNGEEATKYIWAEGLRLTLLRDVFIFFFFFSQCSFNLCFVVMPLLSVVFHTDKRKTSLEVIEWEVWNWSAIPWKQGYFEKCACPLPVTGSTGVEMAVVSVACQLPSSYWAKLLTSSKLHQAKT